MPCSSQRGLWGRLGGWGADSTPGAWRCRILLLLAGLPSSSDALRTIRSSADPTQMTAAQKKKGLWERQKEQRAGEEMEG